MSNIRSNINKLNSLLELVEEALNTMDDTTIKRLRSSTEKFIYDIYGPKSVFSKNYTSIDKWSSSANFKEIKGLLHAMKDDITDSNNSYSTKWNQDGMEHKRKHLDELRLKILNLFMKNRLYNWEAVENLIKGDADYFEFALDDAQLIFNQFIDKKIITLSGFGKAYVITEEGEKLFQRMSPKLNVEKPDEVLTTRTNKFEWDVFLCHSSKDKETIKKIISDFKNRRISYWVDDNQINPGDNIIQKITKGLEGSSMIIACISEAQLNSGWCRNEYEAIMQKIITNGTKQKIIPLLLENISDDRMPPFLNIYRRERYFVPEEYERLLSHLKTIH